MKNVMLTLGLAVIFGSALTGFAEETPPAPAGTNTVEAVGITKAQFVKTRMEWSKSNPHWKPTPAGLEAEFDQRDVNKDGRLSPAEEKAKLKNQWVNQRLEWARTNPHWKPTREELEKSFTKLDANADGLLTPEEEAAGKKSETK